MNKQMLHQDGDETSIYCYNEYTKSLEKLGRKTNGNTITTTVNHFSTYGVFAAVLTMNCQKLRQICTIGC